MQNRITGPLAFIHIIDIFRETGQIDYMYLPLINWNKNKT